MKRQPSSSLEDEGPPKKRIHVEDDQIILPEGNPFGFLPDEALFHFFTVVPPKEIGNWLRPICT